MLRRESSRCNRVFSCTGDDARARRLSQAVERQSAMDVTLKGHWFNKGRQRCIAISALVTLMLAALVWRANPVQEMPSGALACTKVASPIGRTFHVDPLNGSLTGNGSAERPWKSLQAKLAAGLVGDMTVHPTFLRSFIARFLPGGDQMLLVHNSAALVRGGDTIVLHAGNHGHLDLSGLRNHSFINVEAAPGTPPKVDSLTLNGASNVIVRGLVVENWPRGDEPRELVRVGRLSGFARAENIRLLDMVIGSTRQIFTVPREEWARLAPSGVLLRGDCLELTNSKIHDTRFGVNIYHARRTSVASNEIQGFSVDGIDFTGNEIVIRNNVIADHWMTGDGLHPDCMQGQAIEGDPLFGPILIEGNLCIARTSDRADPGEYLQGVNIFDGSWKSIRIRCNRIANNAGHGIALYGTNNARIEHNVVVGLSAEWPTWIASLPSKSGRQPIDNLIYGNSSTGYLNVLTNRSDQDSQDFEDFNISHDEKLINVVRDRVTGVRLENNILAVRSFGMRRPPSDERIKEVVLTHKIKAMSVGAFRRAFPLPSPCKHPVPQGYLGATKKSPARASI